MYQTYFNLPQRPFAAVPQVDQYFPAAAIEAARAVTARCVQRGEGVAVVVGPSGTGKTLLCQRLARDLGSQLPVALLSCGRTGTRRALFQAILYELKQPYRGMDEGELRLALVEHLTSSEPCRDGIVLLVDDAHTLPLRLLDEICSLTNLTRNGEPEIRLVLSGGRMLEEHLTSPKLDSFAQRIVARCYLEPLKRAETEEYIHARIAAAGGDGPRLFPGEACQSVYKATDGVPRLVNQVCDHALLLAFAAGRRQIQAADVEEAWADLQQLPSPWDAQRRKPACSVIEFGGLDDEDAGRGEQEGGSLGVAACSAGEAGPAAEASETPTLLKVADAPPSLRASSEAVPPDAQDLEPVERLRHIQQMLAEVDEEFRPEGSIAPEVELVFDDYPFKEQFEQEEVVRDRYARPAPAAAAGAAESDLVPELAPSPACGFAAAETADRQTVPILRSNLIGETEPEDRDLVEVENNYDDAPPWPSRPVAPVRRSEFGRLFAKLRRK